MPDAVEPRWQDVDKEAAHELSGIEGHGCVAGLTLFAIILDLEGDAAAIESGDAAV